MFARFNYRYDLAYEVNEIVRVGPRPEKNMLRGELSELLERKRLFDAGMSKCNEMAEQAMHKIKPSPSYKGRA